ncbi:hypothetical protein PVAND_008844 [Polypedilum vanderplanki]|uniref:AMP-dependent synthetase/ligase domain-containing protein n=1 Tax=Polypedilum vanderplanki TaxID=319348 RepID=A0A9J6CBM1_POLVA|nr:hypothetical protein PVAND_008844 [Polypedilum vanderplanki]
MIKSSSKIILKTLLSQSWKQQHQILRLTSIHLQKTRNFHLTQNSRFKFKDFEHFHDQMKNLKPKTMTELFNKTVADFPDRNALMYKKEGSDVWTAVTYKEYKNKVKQIAKAFIKLGLEKDGKVAVLAFNSKECVI